MKTKLLLAVLGITLLSCQTKIEKEYVTEPCPEEEKIPMAQLKAELTEKGFQTFDYVDEKLGDTILMQQYFIAFLKKGPARSQTKEEADSLQKLHLAHLGRMYEEGFADISGPFGDDGDKSRTLRSCKF